MTKNQLVSGKIDISKLSDESLDVLFNSLSKERARRNGWILTEECINYIDNIIAPLLASYSELSIKVSTPKTINITHIYTYYIDEEHNLYIDEDNCIDPQIYIEEHLEGRNLFRIEEQRSSYKLELFKEAETIAKMLTIKLNDGTGEAFRKICKLIVDYFKENYVEEDYYCIAAVYGIDID